MDHFFKASGFTFVGLGRTLTQNRDELREEVDNLKEARQIWEEERRQLAVQLEHYKRFSDSSRYLDVV